MPVLVGTSGWQYDSWRGPFYPPELPKRLWLERHCSQVADGGGVPRLLPGRYAGGRRAAAPVLVLPELRDVLTRHGAALCWADKASEPVAPLWRTADWGYLRLHLGGGDAVWPYEQAVLDRWAGVLADTWDDGELVYGYTNNDPGGAALVDGARLAALLRARGRTVGRTPAA